MRDTLSIHHTIRSSLVIAAALAVGCGDDTAMSGTATDSGGGSSSGGATDPTPPTSTSGNSDSATSDSTMGGSDSQTGSTTGTTEPTTEGVTSGPTTETTSTTDPGTSSTTTGDTTSSTISDTSTTVGDTSTSTTTGDASTSTTGEGSSTTGDDTTGGNEVLPGSCRLSELYGSAGARPAFTDPNYANFLGKQVAITTTSQQQTQFLLHVVDISGPTPPPNINYAAPRYSHPSWTVANLGRIFGLTLDSFGNIYVAASAAYGPTQNPGVIRRIDAVTGAITVFATLPNNGPSLGNLNYDCVSETIYVSNHEDGRIYQYNLKGEVMSTYRHSTKNVTLGLPNDPGEPNGVFTPLGDRVWGVQSHAGRLYYGVWWEDTNRSNAQQNNEVWSVAYVDTAGVPDPATAKLEFKLPDGLLNPIADISFAADGRMLVARRTMTGDTQSLAHQSNVLTYESVNGTWQPLGELHKVGELVNSAAGGVDHDFAPNGYVWMTGDALDFYTPNVVYGLQGTPLAGGAIQQSTLIDLDSNLTAQAKTAQGDVEVPIPDDVQPVPPPK